LRPLVLVAVLSFSLPALAQIEDPIGHIVQVTGQGRVTNPALNRDLEARLNLNLYQGDTITTEEESQIKILLADDSLMRVGDASELTLDEFVYDPDAMVRQTKLGMPLGKVKILVNDLVDFKEKRFEVHTPTAVAGVRGTLLLVLVESADLTIIVGYDQPVYVYNPLMPDVRVIVAGQTMTQIMAQQAPTTPVPLSDADRGRFQKMFPASETPGLAPQEATEEGGGGGEGGEGGEDGGGAPPTTAAGGEGDGGGSATTARRGDGGGGPTTTAAGGGVTTTTAPAGGITTTTLPGGDFGASTTTAPTTTTTTTTTTSTSTTTTTTTTTGPTTTTTTTTTTAPSTTTTTTTATAPTTTTTTPTTQAPTSTSTSTTSGATTTTTSNPSVEPCPEEYRGACQGRSKNVPPGRSKSVPVELLTIRGH